jgi:hypothetical protein
MVGRSASTSTPRWVLLAIVVALPLLGLASCGTVLLAGGTLIGLAGWAGDKQIAALGGCPSSQTPRPPHGVLKDNGRVTIGLPASAAGCWEAYADGLSADEVYGYYTSSASLANWQVVKTYPQTRYVRLSSKSDARVLVDVYVGTGGGSIGWGPTRTRIDISICRCDPDLMLG